MQEASRFYFYIKRSAILREDFREVNFPREFPLIKRRFLLFLKGTNAMLLVIYLGECFVTELLAARIFFLMRTRNSRVFLCSRKSDDE